MRIVARLRNSRMDHQVQVQTGDQIQSVAIPAKASGKGSAINGGEFLFLALATCYCNDVYREAAKRRISVEEIEIEVAGEFLQEGGCGSNIEYRVKIKGDASNDELDDLALHTDRVAEVQNTLRQGVDVRLTLK